MCILFEKYRYRIMTYFGLIVKLIIILMLYFNNYKKNVLLFIVGSSEDVKSADVNKLNMSRRSKPVVKAMSPNRQGPQQCLVSIIRRYT